MALKDDYYVVDFEHIDDFRCTRALREALAEGIAEDTLSREQQTNLQALREELSHLFLAAGWEGDGEIECIFIAPCFSSRGWTSCEIVYHVKQSNNGTSWLAIPKDLRLQLPEGFLSTRR